MASVILIQHKRRRPFMIEWVYVRPRELTWFKYPKDTPWSSLKMAPIDVTFGLSKACKKDSRSPKVNLAIGVYSNDDGSPFVFPVVHEVEKYIAGKGLDKEYAGILGLESFRRASLEFALGSESKAMIGGLCATAQTVAGTSALR
uniref:Aspartate aminotransferase, mitochondrial n=1 Tax=Amphimedon queenslandica TaxID=400682 RepID=A0A1X7SM33_AMPQE